MEKLEARNVQAVREVYCGLIERRVESERMATEPRWSEPVVVGSERFVRQGAGRLGIEVGSVGEKNEQET